MIAPAEVEVEAKIEQFRQEPALWDSDPVEKYFSGLPSAANGLRLSGRVDTQTSDALILTLRVEGTDGKTLEGNVTFLLHPTLPNPVQVVTTRNNAAQTTIYTEGWFHAAAVAEAGRTVLVLDLRTIPGVPEWYTKA